MVACVNDSVPANEISPSASIQRLYLITFLNYIVVFPQIFFS